MEETNQKGRKGLIIIIIMLLLIILLGGFYLLNDKYEWIKFNKEKEEVNNDNKDEEEKEEIKDLTFDNRLLLSEMIKSNKTDINKELTTSENELLDKYMDKFDTIYDDLEIEINEKITTLNKKDKITSSDASDFESFLIEKEETYNSVINELFGESDYDLSLIILSKVKLLDYYYIDTIEGSYFVDVNYAAIFNALKDKLEASKKDYYILKNNIYEYNGTNSLYKDAGLIVTWEEYKDVILAYDDYTQRYPSETKALDTYDTLFDIYTGEFTLDNTPIYEDKAKTTIKSEVLDTYKDIVDNHLDFSRYDEIKTIYEENK